MNIPDEQLIAVLIARDGPLPQRTRRHWASGACRYAETVGDRPCPWCAAEQRRLDSAASGSGGGPQP